MKDLEIGSRLLHCVYGTVKILDVDGDDTVILLVESTGAEIELNIRYVYSLPPVPKKRKRFRLIRALVVLGLTISVFGIISIIAYSIGVNYVKG